MAAEPAGPACDLPAGPSEVLVVADDTAQADFIAADLLAQAEHDVLSQALLVTDSARLAAAVAGQIERQLPLLSRRAILARSLESCRALVVATLDDGHRTFEPLRPRASVAAGARAASPPATGQQRRLDLPRAVVAGDARRLLLRHESCAAHLRPRPHVQRTGRARFPQDHVRAGDQRRRAYTPRAHRGDAGAARGPRRSRQCGHAAPRIPGRRSPQPGPWKPLDELRSHRSRAPRSSRSRPTRMPPGSRSSTRMHANELPWRPPADCRRAGSTAIRSRSRRR